MSKLVEEEIVLHGAVSEAKPAKNVVEEENVLHGGSAEPNVAEKDDPSFLQNKTSTRQRRHKIRKCSCCQ